MGNVLMTRTACELFYSPEFWKKRCADQLKYIQEIESSDRTPDRKAELQMSALEIYRYCLESEKDAIILRKIMLMADPHTSFAPRNGSLSMEINASQLFHNFSKSNH